MYHYYIDKFYINVNFGFFIILLQLFAFSITCCYNKHTSKQSEHYVFYSNCLHLEVIIISSKLKYNYIYKKFKNNSFTNKQLYALYLETEPELKYSTFRWRVYSLKEKKCI